VELEHLRNSGALPIVRSAMGDDAVPSLPRVVTTPGLVRERLTTRLDEAGLGDHCTGTERSVVAGADHGRNAHCPAVHVAAP
jgi:hypothetical protein